MEDVAEGAITVELQSKRIPDFDDYVSRLTPDSNSRNPWFREYWEQVFSCRLPHTTLMSDAWLGVRGAHPLCPPDLRITSGAKYTQESKVQFVVDAVYAFAQALDKAWRDLCLPDTGVCRRLRDMDGRDFYNKYLLTVNFTGQSIALFFLSCMSLRPGVPSNYISSSKLEPLHKQLEQRT